MSRNFDWPPENGAVIEYGFKCPFAGSHVLSGTRPAIIYRKDDMILGIPITTARKPKKLPTHIVLPSGTGNLPATSLGLIEAIQTVNSQSALKQIGEIDPSEEIWQRIKRRIRIQFGVDFKQTTQPTVLHQGDVILVGGDNSMRVVVSNNTCNSVSPVITTAKVAALDLVNTQYIQANLQLFGKLYRADLKINLGEIEIFDKVSVTATIGSCNRKKLLEGLLNFIN